MKPCPPWSHATCVGGALVRVFYWHFSSWMSGPRDLPVYGDRIDNLGHKKGALGRLGSSVGSASDFGSGHDLTVRGFEPHVGLCADSSEPGAASDSVSFSVSPPLTLCLSLSKINIKFFF